mgnify:CR=1 FL=1
MQLVYGTGNVGKLRFMQQILSPLPIEILGLAPFAGRLPAIDEAGNDPLENARIKAAAYYEALGQPVFSCDSGLYLEGLPDELQPGVHVREVGGRRLSDDEMIEHYIHLAKRCGGTCRAAYRNAISLVFDRQHVYSYMGDDISGETFLLSSVPHPERRDGFPLDSLSIHIDSGQYYFDLGPQRVSTTAAGFLAFFRRALPDISSFSGPFLS